MTWLHVSDVHFDADTSSYDRRVVLKSLVSRAKEYWQAGRRPDLVFFTGDLASSGKDAEYAHASAFFDHLLDAVQLSREQLFVVPGNHDVNRDAGRGLGRTLGTLTESDDFFDPDRPGEHFVRLTAFRRWYDRYLRGVGSATTCTPPVVVRVRDVRVGILPINSAVFAAGNDDHGKLWVGRRPLDEATSRLEEQRPDIVVAMLHHPLDWLHDAERAVIKAALGKHADFVLRGHLHESDFEAVVYPGSRSGAFHMAAGAVYQGPRYPARCLFVTLDLDSGRVTIYPIHYVETPEPVWVLDTALFPREPHFEATHFVPWKRGGGSTIQRTFGESGFQSRPKHGESVEIAGMKFVYLDGGDFEMGALADDSDAFWWERPAHSVRMPGFWIGQTPVTRQQFARFLVEASYRRPPYWRDVRSEDSDHPVICENTEDIEAFCRWLTGRAQRVVELSGAGVQLTSEAEWEFAARGTQSRRYPWVEDDLGPPGLRANYDSDSLCSVYEHPKGATPEGVLDLAGNAFERCRDRVGLSLWTYGASDGLVVDPVGRRGDQMALRSCDHRMPARYLRATWRIGNEPLLWRYTMKLPFEGRIARSVARAVGRASTWHEAAVWTTVAKVGFRCTFRIPALAV